MQRIHSSDLKNYLNKKVLVSGWIQDIRILSNIIFLVIKDREGFIQIFLPKNKVKEELFNLCKNLTKESVIQVIGIVLKSKQAKLGFEIIPESIQVLSLANTPTPIDTSGKINSDLSVRLDHRFLDLRNPKRIAIFKIRSKTALLVSEFFDSNGFININTPKITTTGVESGAELFEVNYFGRKAFLAQSPQIYKQMMVAAGLEKVYEIGAVFRAEKSHTTRHLTEFTGIDFEQAFIESEQDIMDTNENLMKFIIKGLNKQCKEQLELILGHTLIEPKKIPRITMKEAKEMLAKKGKRLPEKEDFDPEAEKMLGEIIKKEFDSDFVFVYLYPWEKRPFYHMLPENDKSVTKSFDLLWNGLEIATGAQREHRYEILKEQAKRKGIDLDQMKDYANIFKYGCPPHGGTGLGLDRIIEAMLCLDNIREGILLPRDPLRLNP